MFFYRLNYPYNFLLLYTLFLALAHAFMLAFVLMGLNL